MPADVPYGMPLIIQPSMWPYNEVISNSSWEYNLDFSVH